MYSPHVFHPVLEGLEDRTAFAVDVVTSPVAQPPAAGTLAAPAQLAPVAPVIGLSGPNFQLNQGTLLREVVPQASLVQTLGTTSTAVPTIADAPPASFALPGPPPQTAQVPSSFPGRIVLTGTGVQQRVAFGNGPFTQAPGLYQVGGGGGDENLPVPTQRQRPAPQIPLSAPGEATTLSVSHDQADVSDADAAWLLPPAPDDR
jgi:hypothetical protein